MTFHPPHPSSVNEPQLANVDIKNQTRIINTHFASLRDHLITSLQLQLRVAEFFFLFSTTSDHRNAYYRYRKHPSVLPWIFSNRFCVKLIPFVFARSLYCPLVISCWKCRFWIAAVGNIFTQVCQLIRFPLMSCWWNRSLIKQISKRFHLWALLTSLCFLGITGSIQTNDVVCGALLLSWKQSGQSKAGMCEGAVQQSVKMKHLWPEAERLRLVWNRGQTMSGWTGAQNVINLGACALMCIHLARLRLEPKSWPSSYPQK